ncbi:hypothetical protein VNO80_16910 [Phaseolus coccineus]|uniref:Uncharacterized protein n=1 Tax=Phaseolus coccineus TaxID=3886 RepID=A0AAN9MMM3_PHACN
MAMAGLVRKAWPLRQLLNTIRYTVISLREGITGMKPITHFYFRPGWASQGNVNQIGMPSVSFWTYSSKDAQAL